MDVKEVNKMITKAKRLWGGKKREIIYTDRIEKEEAEIFKGDEHLALMVYQREQLENKIVSYIDEKLAEARGNVAPAPGDVALETE